MPKITLIYSVALILLGLFAYFIWGDQQSWTALIPSAGGVLVLIFGLFALKEKLRMHAMHVTALLSLILFLGTVRGVPSFFQLLQGEEVARPLAAKVQSITALLSLIYIVLCIRSFILARLKKS